MTKRIFVSSTSIDLSEYRKRVQESIKQLGAIDISMENLVQEMSDLKLNACGL